MQAAAAPAQSPFLIDQIFSTRAIHLVSGPSGIGKTTYLLQLLNDWTAGKEVLERKSFPVPWCFMNCARGADESKAIVQRCEFASVPPESMVSLPYDRSLPEDATFESALKMARHRVPGVRLLVLDAISSLVRGRTNEDGVISEFMRRIHHVCLQDNMTVIGIGLHAKDAEGPSRAKFAGSIAWGCHASTMMVIEGKEDEPDRTVKIFGQNFPPEIWTYQVGTDGKFILTTDESAAFGALDMHLGKLQPGEEFETATVLQWGKDIGCSRATLMRWVQKRIDDGVIERTRRGVYKVKFKA